MKRLSTLPVTALTVAIVAAVTLSVARPASAVLIKTGITTLFYDDFESDTVGSQPPVVPATPGAWASVAGNFTVVNSASPGPAQGNNYLRAVRPGSGVAIADFGQVTSGTVTAIFGVFIPTGSNDALIQVSLGPTLDSGLAGISSAPVWLVNDDNGGGSPTVHTFIGPPAGTDFDTGVPLTYDVWQKWRIDYTFNTVNNNDDTFTISVDNNTSTAINGGGFANVLDPANIRYLSFRTGDVGTFYIDAIPEPASLGVLAMSGLFLTRRRAR